MTHNQLDYLTNRYDADRRLLCQLAGRTGAEFDGVRSTGGLEAVEDQPYCHGALADRGRGTLDRAAADVADGEDSRPAGLEEQRSRGFAVESGRRNVGAGEQEPVAVFGELASQPAGPGFGADKDEQPPDGELGLAAGLIVGADEKRLKMRCWTEGKSGAAKRFTILAACSTPAPSLTDVEQLLLAFR